MAGNGISGYNGDGILATSAELYGPNGVAVDSAGNLYIAETLDSRIRKVTAATGDISTVAGNGTTGYSEDGVAATSAELKNPTGVAVDGAGNLYIADLNSNRVRMVTAATGDISTAAGNGTGGFNEDGVPATSAELALPYGVAVDGAGNLYIADFGNNRIRMVTAQPASSLPWLATALAASRGWRRGHQRGAVFPHWRGSGWRGNLYIADELNNRIRLVTAATGIITTVAGDGTAGYGGDAGAATGADSYPSWRGSGWRGQPVHRGPLQQPHPQGSRQPASSPPWRATALEATTRTASRPPARNLTIPLAQRGRAGNLYIVDGDNFRIREVSVSTPPTLTFPTPTAVGGSTRPMTRSALRWRTSETSRWSSRFRARD